MNNGCKHYLSCGLCELTGKMCRIDTETDINTTDTIQNELDNILNSTTSEFINISEYV